MIKYNTDFDEDLMHMGDEHARNIEKTMAEIIDLTGKNAIVTGGTTGLGYAVTNRLALAGAKVVICGRTAAKGEIAEKQFRDRGLDVTYVQADITYVSECEKVVKFCEETYGPVDILVNNAARWIHHSLVDQEEEMFDAVMDLNVKGSYFMAKYAARSMIENRRVGKIVNVGSSAYLGDDSPTGLLTTYNASKGAIVSLTKGEAKELKQYGINVNCVVPGSMDTYGNEEPPVGMEDYFEIDGFAAALAGSGEMPYDSPDECAKMVFVFCTELCNFSYGEVVKAQGGRPLKFSEVPCAVTMDIPDDYTPPRRLRKKKDGSRSNHKW